MDTLQQIVEQLVDTLNDHGAKIVTSLLLMAAGWYLGRRQGRKDWDKKEFFDRINFSLNRIEDGVLRIRTLCEKRLEEVYLNQHAADVVRAAAQRTTEADPLIPLPDAEYWHYLNPVLNEVSEQFALGQIKLDLGRPVVRGDYLIFLTCEKAGAVRMRKVRAMILKKSLLTQLPEEPPKFESATHSVRWDTLQVLAMQYKQNPQRFLDVEICV